MILRTRTPSRGLLSPGAVARIGLLACLALTPTVAAHTLSEERVLVDTDAALDDLRALALLLSLPAIDTLGVVSVGGSARADRGAALVGAFLDRLGHPDLPVWVGTSSERQPPAWRSLYDALAGRLAEPATGPGPKPGWRAGVTRMLRSHGGPLTILALGPLTNLADLFAGDSGLAKRITKVVWFGCPAGGRTCFNRDFDPQAAERVEAMGIPIVYVAAAESAEADPVFDRALLDELRRYGGRAADALGWLFDLPEARQRLDQRHLRIWDELAVLFLVRPEAFAQRAGLRLAAPAWIRPALIHFFRGPSGVPMAKDTEAFERFPTAAGLFRADLAARVPALLARYGPDEFRGCVLVCELHQHLGAFSLVGVKMAMRAREILGEPDHPLRVTSMAGSSPPLSCLNDGLQVGAGATVGLGLLKVHAKGKPRVEATFTRDGRKVTLALKPEVKERIQKEIAVLKARHSGFTADYYDDLRAVAIRLWFELDRKKIFDQKPIAP